MSDAFSSQTALVLFSGGQDSTTCLAWALSRFARVETLVAAKGVATSDLLHRYRDAWDHAADRTPHGMPIELTPEDFG